jgi:hypothetical protein
VYPEKTTKPHSRGCEFTTTNGENQMNRNYRRQLAKWQSGNRGYDMVQWASALPQALRPSDTFRTTEEFLQAVRKLKRRFRPPTPAAVQPNVTMPGLQAVSLKYAAEISRGRQIQSSMPN